MSGKEQFIKLPRDVLESAAFASLGINAFRFVRFLMIEHMRRGGRQNGNLKAPQRQLVAFGIGTHQLTAAIGEAEESGLVECHRHGIRIATTYALTWLPLHDDSAASNEWREYQPPAKQPKNLSVKQQAGLPVKQQAGGSNLPVNQQAEPSGNLPVNQQALYRSSYQGGCGRKVVEGEGYREPVEAEPVEVLVSGIAEPGAEKGETPEATTSPNPGKPPLSRCGFRIVTALGEHPCGMLAPAGADLCVDHAWRVQR